MTRYHTLNLDTMEATDLLIAVEYELSMRCHADQPMTTRLEKIRHLLLAEIGLKATPAILAKRTTI